MAPYGPAPSRPTRYTYHQHHHHIRRSGPDANAQSGSGKMLVSQYPIGCSYLWNTQNVVIVVSRLVSSRTIMDLEMHAAAAIEIFRNFAINSFEMVAWPSNAANDLQRPVQNRKRRKRRRRKRRTAISNQWQWQRNACSITVFKAKTISRIKSKCQKNSCLFTRPLAFIIARVPIFRSIHIVPFGLVNE